MSIGGIWGRTPSTKILEPATYDRWLGLEPRSARSPHHLPVRADDVAHPDLQSLSDRNRRWLMKLWRADDPG
jgi:hypothetical protein